MFHIENIWKEYKNAMHGFIKKRVADAHVADDLLQEVFLKIHKASGDTGSVTNIRAWIYGITRNAITDYYRSKKYSSDIPDHLTYPEDDRKVLREISTCMMPMIENLPNIYREALILSDIEGLSQKQVAEIQGISHSGAKSRVQRGRRMLKDMMLRCCRFEFDRKGSVIDYRKNDQDCG